MRCIRATAAAVASSQAEAPNTTATPVQARARPMAERAMAISADSSPRRARSESAVAEMASRPVCPTWRMVSSIGGVAPACWPASPLRSPSLTAVPSAVAAAQRGHQPAGGEGDAEGGQRTLADQLRSAVQQVAALVQQGVDLLARGLATHLGGSHAGKGGVGQFGLDVGLAQAQFLAAGGGGATQGLAGGTSGGLEVGAGFVEVALDVLARAGAPLRSPVWGMPGWQDVGIRPRCRCRSRYGCTAYCRTSRPRTLPRSISSTNWAGRPDRVLRRVARSSTWPALVAVITSPGRSPLAAARLPLATFSTSTPRPQAWRRVSGSSARVAPERRGSMVSPDRLRGCSRRVALSSSVRPSRI